MNKKKALLLVIILSDLVSIKSINSFRIPKNAHVPCVPRSKCWGPSVHLVLY